MMIKEKILYIHETDPHGTGEVIYDGKIEHYSYDLNCDMKEAILLLRNMGALNMQVEIIEGCDIYDYLPKEK